MKQRSPKKSAVNDENRQVMIDFLYTTKSLLKKLKKASGKKQPKSKQKS